MRRMRAAEKLGKLLFLYVNKVIDLVFLYC